MINNMCDIIKNMTYIEASCSFSSLWSEFVSLLQKEVLKGHLKLP